MMGEAINKDRHKPGRQEIMETMPKTKSLQQFVTDVPLRNSRHGFSWTPGLQSPGDKMGGNRGT